MKTNRLEPYFACLRQAGKDKRNFFIRIRIIKPPSPEGEGIGPRLKARDFQDPGLDFKYMDQQKGFTNIVLIVLVVVLAGVVGYFTLVKKSPEIAQQTNTPTPTPIQIQNPTPTPTPAPTIVSNIFTYKSKPGDKVGGMVLSKINHPTSQTEPAGPDYVYAEFTGTITVTGRLSAPTGNPEDGGMGPEYSLNNLTQDSLKRLPYLQSDTRTVWFGIKNPDVMKNSPAKNGDLVELTINKYEYVFFPAGVWNQADAVAVKKIQ